MKKILLSALLTLSVLSSTAMAADLSDWAEDGYIQASSAGLISYNVVSNNLQNYITREEFCELSVNLYERLTGDELMQPELFPFEDSDNIYVAMAYELGMVSGDETGNFHPKNPVTRQEMAKMLVNTLNISDINISLSTKEKAHIKEYTDSGDVSAWAVESVATMLKYGLMNGVTATTLAPTGNATREQAIVMSNRSYTKFARTATEMSPPVITSPKNHVNLKNDVKITWEDAEGGQKYSVIIKDETGTPIYEKRVIGMHSVSVDMDTFEKGKTYTVIIGTKIDNAEVFSSPIDFTFDRQTPSVTPGPTAKPGGTAKPATTEKEKRVFPNGTYFANQEEADRNMKRITVNVWNVDSNNEKTASTRVLAVNKNLADEVVQIFEEIFQSEEQFPIYSVGAYNWRNSASGNLSQHSYGTCIDINPNENYYISMSGTIYSGSLWKPGENQYSIAEDSDVVKIFAKYGWAWGGNAWTSSRDYMHFSYLGN